MRRAIALGVCCVLVAAACTDDGDESGGTTPAATDAPEPEPEVVAEEICTIRTRRGAEVVEIEIPCSE